MSATLVKSTLNLKKDNKDALEQLVKLNELNSVTEGVNEAIELFIKEKRREIYAREMKKAAVDKDFLKRTMGAQVSFEYADAEMDVLMVAEDSEW